MSIDRQWLVCRVGSLLSQTCFKSSSTVNRKHLKVSCKTQELPTSSWAACWKWPQWAPCLASGLIWDAFTINCWTLERIMQNYAHKQYTHIYIFYSTWEPTVKQLLPSYLGNSTTIPRGAIWLLAHQKACGELNQPRSKDSGRHIDMVRDQHDNMTCHLQTSHSCTQLHPSFFRDSVAMAANTDLPGKWRSHWATWSWHHPWEILWIESSNTCLALVSAALLFLPQKDQKSGSCAMLRDAAVLHPLDCWLPLVQQPVTVAKGSAKLDFATRSLSP